MNEKRPKIKGLRVPISEASCFSIKIFCVNPRHPRFPRPAFHRGNEKQIFAPVPADESAQIRSPWASMMARASIHEFYTNNRIRGLPFALRFPPSEIFF